jgi:predicted phosphoribosyltransferase
MQERFYPFADRAESGKFLSKHLAGYAGRIDTVVTALNLNSTPVAVEVAEAIGAPFENWPPADAEGKTIIVAAEGLESPEEMRKAAWKLHARDAAWIVAAAPVGSIEAIKSLEGEADEVICPMTPEPFEALEMWYQNLPTVTEDDLHNLQLRLKEKQDFNTAALGIPEGLHPPT